MFGIKELERAFRDLEIDYNGVLKNEDKIFEDLELDSLMIVTLICYIEDQYHVSINEDELNLNENSRIGDLVGMLNK